MMFVYHMLIYSTKHMPFAGKQSMIVQHNGGEFQSSDSYYIKNFGQNEIKFDL